MTKTTQFVATVVEHIFFQMWILPIRVRIKKCGGWLRFWNKMLVWWRDQVMCKLPE